MPSVLVERVIGTTWPGLPSSAMYAVEPSGVIAIASGFVMPVIAVPAVFVATVIGTTVLAW